MYSRKVKNKNGISTIFTISYNDPLTGKKKYKSVTHKGTRFTKTERRKIEKNIQKKINQEYGKSDRSMVTLGDLKYEYLQLHSIEVKKSTATDLRYKTDQIIRLMGGDDILVSAITPHAVCDRLMPPGDNPAGTFNNRLKFFKQFLRWGTSREIIDPREDILAITPLREKTRYEKLRDKYLEIDEIYALLSAMTDDRQVYYLTWFLIFSGLRIGEALALYPDDVDIDNKEIHVSKTLTQYGEIQPPKTAKSKRDVPMNQNMLEEIGNMWKYEHDLSQKFGYKWKLFFMNSKTGTYIQYQWYCERLKKTAMTALSREITPHTLRHTYTSLMAAEGVSIETISRALGHSGDKITLEIYTHETKKLKEHDKSELSRVVIPIHKDDFA